MVIVTRQLIRDASPPADVRRVAQGTEAVRGRCPVMLWTGLGRGAADNANVAVLELDRQGGSHVRTHGGGVLIG